MREYKLQGLYPRPVVTQYCYSGELCNGFREAVRFCPVEGDGMNLCLEVGSVLQTTGDRLHGSTVGALPARPYYDRRSPSAPTGGVLG